VFRSSPKVFLGYSDTTVTHLALFKAGLVSFYGPAIMANFAENRGMFPYMVSSVRRTLFSSAPVGTVEPHRGGWTAEELDWALPENQQRARRLNPHEGWRFLQGSGVARGRLLGGSLEVVEFLRGTELWPEDDSWRGAILFLENLSGILLAKPGGDIPVERFGEDEEALLQVVAGEQQLVDLPVNHAHGLRTHGPDVCSTLRRRGGDRQREPEVLYRRGCGRGLASAGDRITLL
jgi:LD-carboxypeptidase C-terminal domain/LD-carboxypeptidase N-terminal domain